MGGSRKGTRVGKQGTSTSGRLQMSPSARRRHAKRLAAEEARWAAMAGPVTVRQVEPNVTEDKNAGRTACAGPLGRA